MVSIGFALVVFGFGSLILEQFNMQFRILAWAQDFQPWLGIVLGLVGVALVVLGYMRGKNQGQAQQPPSSQGQPPFPQHGQQS